MRIYIKGKKYNNVENVTAGQRAFLMLWHGNTPVAQSTAKLQKPNSEIKDYWDRLMDIFVGFSSLGSFLTFYV